MEKSFRYVCGDLFAKWRIEPYDISTSISVFPCGIFGFVFQSRSMATFSKGLLVF